MVEEWKPILFQRASRKGIVQKQFKERKTKKFPSLVKVLNTQIEEIQQILKEFNPRTLLPKISIKCLKTKGEE